MLMDCITNPRWRMPPKGKVTLDYHVLQFSIDPQMVRGSVALDLQRPWERVVASSLYRKIRRREMRRLSIVGGFMGVFGEKRAPEDESDAPSDDELAPHRASLDGGRTQAEELPEWEGRCTLDGKEVPLDRMVRLPQQGVVTIMVSHTHERARMRCSLAFSLHMQVVLPPPSAAPTMSLHRRALL